MQAEGVFTIQMTPESGGPGNSMRLMKQYSGGLTATAEGVMISGGDPRAGVAGYVAFETVTGTLDGREGSFQLMQWGTMKTAIAGDPPQVELRVSIVPGSGTAALAGILGTCTITNAAGQHSYVLEYALPEMGVA